MSKLRIFSTISNKIVLNQRNVALATLTRGLASLPEDKATHTGQKWAADDYRMARFVDRPKHVNPNFSIKLIAEVPPQACTERVASCDGGGGPTGHPKVYIKLDKPGNHACGYCGLRFFLDHKH